VNLGRILGRPLDPWQRDIALGTGELTDTGTLAYPTVVLVVPRRAGKTLVALLCSLGVIVGGPGRRAWYTLHRREIGAALWRDEFFPMLEAANLAGPSHRQLLGVRRSNGSEAVTVRRLGSTLRLFAPSGEALRSQNADVVVVDEGREFTADAGATLEAAVRPAQARRAMRQLWVLSSAPGPRAPATWLRGYRDTGRAAVEEGRREGTFYVEFAAPRDLPYDHPDTWARGHPAIAAGHITPEALVPDLEKMDEATFQAEYLGWWAPEHELGGAIDLPRWNALTADLELAGLHPWRIAVDVAPDRSRAAIAVAAPTAPGRCHVELVAHGPGVTWVIGAALELVHRHRAHRLVVDTWGPVSNLADELDLKARGQVDRLDTPEAARSCSTFVDLITDGAVSHRGQPEVTEALVAASSRRYGEVWLWDRRATPPEVCALTWAAAAAAAPTPPAAVIVSSARQ
jgi:hypothetical protein